MKAYRPVFNDIVAPPACVHKINWSMLMMYANSLVEIGKFGGHVNTLYLNLHSIWIILAGAIISLSLHWL